MIIGIHGKALSGKDTIADMFVKERGFIKLAFADKLKDVASLAFDIPRCDFDDQEKKKVLDTRYGLSIREILQLLGTECFRSVFGNNFWLNVIDNEMKKHPNDDFVISDVRFRDEYDFIISKNGHTIKMIRDIETDIPQHKSEDGLPDSLFHLIIRNDGTIADLLAHVERALVLFK